MEEQRHQGIVALQSGDRATARRLLTEVIQASPDDTLAWRWLADAVDSAVERRICLERLVALHVDDPSVREELERMGPPPAPEPSAGQIITAVTCVVGSAHAERRPRRRPWMWSWVHSF